MVSIPATSASRTPPCARRRLSLFSAAKQLQGRRQGHSHGSQPSVTAQPTVLMTLPRPVPPARHRPDTDGELGMVLGPHARHPGLQAPLPSFSFSLAPTHSLSPPRTLCVRSPPLPRPSPSFSFSCSLSTSRTLAFPCDCCLSPRRRRVGLGIAVPRGEGAGVIPGRGSDAAGGAQGVTVSLPPLLRSDAAGAARGGVHLGLDRPGPGTQGRRRRGALSSTAAASASRSLPPPCALTPVSSSPFLSILFITHPYPLPHP